MSICNKTGEFVTAFKSVPLTGRVILSSFLLCFSVVPSFVFDKFLAPLLYMLYGSHDELPYVWFVRNRYDIMIAHKYITTDYLYDFLVYDSFVLISVVWSMTYIIVDCCVALSARYLCKKQEFDGYRTLPQISNLLGPLSVRLERY